MARPKEHVFISDEAYATLKKHAIEMMYIAPRAQTAWGLADYIAALSKCSFKDTRPIDIRREDINLLENGFLPEWSMGNIRKKRFMVMTPTTFDTLRSIGLRFGITNLNSMYSVDKRTSVVSATLEAIGIGWLTATNMTPNPHPFQTIRAIHSSTYRYKPPR